MVIHARAGKAGGTELQVTFKTHVSKSSSALAKFPGNIGEALLTVLASSRNSRSSMAPLSSVSYCRNKTTYVWEFSGSERRETLRKSFVRS